MFLLKSWKESLEVFLPKNIVLFGKLTANTMLQTTKTWLSQWWGLLILWGWLAFFSNMIFVFPTQSFSIVLFLWLHSIMPLLILLTLVLAARPSVAIKNNRYYFSYWRHVLVIIGMFYIMCFGFVKVLRAVAKPASVVRFWNANSIVLQYVILPTVLVFLLLWIITFLDTKFHIRALLSSLIRAFKLVVYNYPFVWVMSVAAVFVVKRIAVFMMKVCAYLVISLATEDTRPNLFSGFRDIEFFAASLSFPILGIVLIIPVFLLLSPMMNMYTRQVHEHFDRYY